ncbi:hypothetical protein J6590_001681 [Homalodisca vitripennis]|nr:hypothetical protein J6590_001681 [Homalodisca vitripennis]
MWGGISRADQSRTDLRAACGVTVRPVTSSGKDAINVGGEVSPGPRVIRDLGMSRTYNPRPRPRPSAPTVYERPGLRLKDTQQGKQVLSYGKESGFSPLFPVANLVKYSATNNMTTGEFEDAWQTMTQPDNEIFLTC